MTQPQTVTLSRSDNQRTVTVACEHGATHLSDAELVGDWSDAELIEQATAYHAVDYRDCLCPFNAADNEAAKEVDDVEHERPTILPPLAVSLAGWRIAHGFAVPTDHRLCEWFRHERDSTDETR